MFSNQDQISDVARSSFANQVAAMMALTGTTMESMERLVDLNLNAVRASLEESAEIGRQFMEVRDPQAFLSLMAAQARPSAEKALAYSRHLVSIASSAQEGINRAAEAHLAEANRRMAELMETVTRNAPAGSENMVAMVRSAMGNASAGYEQLQRTTKQATEAIEATMEAAVTQLVQSPDPAATQAANGMVHPGTGKVAP